MVDLKTKWITDTIADFAVDFYDLLLLAMPVLSAVVLIYVLLKLIKRLIAKLL